MERNGKGGVVDDNEGGLIGIIFGFGPNEDGERYWLSVAMQWMRMNWMGMDEITARIVFYGGN